MHGIFLFLMFFIRIIFSLRYKIEIKGIDISQFREKKSLLFLSNHPSRVDPVIFLTLMYQKGVSICPVAVEYLFRWDWLRPILHLFKAISIPDFDTGVNGYKKVKMNETFLRVANDLENGENYLIYPSGRLKKAGSESFGGTSFAYNLVEKVPHCEIVLVRLTGLWGSRFSRVLTGKAPDFLEIAKSGIWAILSNGIFFAPRRKISIEIELAPKSLYTSRSRLEFNRILENWMNRFPDGKGGISKVEPVQFVPLTWWQKKSEELNIPSQAAGREEKSISKETRSSVYAEIKRILNHPDLEIDPKMNLSTDLGMDSLSLAEFSVSLMRRSKMRSIPSEDLQTVQDALEIVEGYTRAAAKSPGHFRWSKESTRPKFELPVGKTLHEALFHTCNRLRRFYMCADDIKGAITYAKFLQGVKVLAEQFRLLPEKKVAIMLPASIGTYVVIFALQLVGKVPVMLNWTLGPRYLEQMMQISGAQRVFTSWNFIDRLQNVEFGEIVDKIEFLEDIRKQIGLKTKLKGLFRKWEFDPSQENETAVLLFTSGTEAAPKAVPLTHKNFISNMLSVFKGFNFTENDITMSALPPFHSLGFSIGGTFPLISGFRTVFFPDPTDASTLAEGISRWEITHVALAPTFLKGILDVANTDELKSVKVFFCGGERTPNELKDRIRNEFSNACYVEGYGVTECSPCVALGHPKLSWKGVGRVLPGIEVIAVHPEKHTLLPSSVVGEICVSGPSVFQGYLDSRIDPFLEIKGKRWYCTGDLGYVDDEGNLILQGRLKRFIKIGAEMISLGAVEDALNEELIKKNATLSQPLIAICPEEKEKTRIVLFTKVPVSREEANEILRKKGFSSLIKIDAVKEMNDIPVTITGKTDYRNLA